MPIPQTATSDLQRLTGYQDLSGHNRVHLNRMMAWKLKAFWPQFYGPRPGVQGCEIPRETLELFNEPERGGTGG